MALSTCRAMGEMHALTCVLNKCTRLWHLNWTTVSTYDDVGCFGVRYFFLNHTHIWANTCISEMDPCCQWQPVTLRSGFMQDWSPLVCPCSWLHSPARPSFVKFSFCRRPQRGILALVGTLYLLESFPWNPWAKFATLNNSKIEGGNANKRKKMSTLVIE